MPRILLVDDSATDRRLFGGQLEKEPEFTIESCDNGVAALKLMERQRPDVVVTDMQMPDMDGLELVKQIRQTYPQVPVILLTGHGSETLAANALKQGAAGYVPKGHSQELLRDTVWHVLELSQAEADYERLIGCASLSQFEFILENDPALIPPLVDLAQRMVGSMGICDATGCLQVGVALRHAILNAIFHGNLELDAAEARKGQLASANGNSAAIQQRREQAPYKDRRVHVTVRITRDEARFVVSDEGPGFDVKEVSEVGLSTSLSGKAGQGLFLMWALMDKVSFGHNGSTVGLVKRRPETDDQTDGDGESAIAEDPTRKAVVLPEVLGELTPKGGGKPFRLKRKRVMVGRTPSCDIVIRSTSVSHHHCVLYLYEGWWYVKDLDSRNGVKVKGVKVAQHLVSPGAMLSIGPHEFELNYTPHDLGAPGITPPVDPF